MTDLQVRRGEERAITRTDWLVSRHSFSYGPHYDPENLRFGLMHVHNEDVVAAGAGFGPHPHRNMEIFTWVLDGRLRHEDSAGNVGEIAPGTLQYLSAGRGVSHSELNADPARAVQFVQVWIEPAEFDTEPDYQLCDLNAELAMGDLVPVSLHTRQPGATLSIGRLTPGTLVEVGPSVFGALSHVFVARGGVELTQTPAADEPIVVTAGDVVRIDGASSCQLRCRADGAEILVWKMSAPSPVA